MKKNFFLLALVALFNTYGQQQEQSLSFTVSSAPKKFAKTSLLLAVNQNASGQFLDVAHLIKNDLEFTGQFKVDLQQFKDVHTKNEIADLASQGFELVVFINEAQNGIEWRLYDTAQVEMIKGTRYTKRGDIMRGWAHNVADSLWLALAGQEGFFSTKIAYCQDTKCANKKKVKHVYVADYDGTNAQLLVSVPTVNVAPRWNNDLNRPILFYSEYTNSNVRLIGATLDKKRKIASNFDGVNMLPCFSADGKKMVYCASKGDGYCQLYYYDKDNKVKKITNNKGNNVSPSFSADGNAVYFCSDYQTDKPQIYCHNLITHECQRISHDGYCASPSFCPKNNRLAYSKIIQGIMQLFLYDAISKEHTQLTYDSGSKEECSWSACGNYILFSVEHGQKSRIALQNIITNHRHYLSPENLICSYPAWSPTYHEFPVIS